MQKSGDSTGTVTVSKAKTTYYAPVTAAKGSITNGTATAATATASICSDHTGDLPKLGTSGTGLSTTAPTSRNRRNRLLDY